MPYSKKTVKQSKTVKNLKYKINSKTNKNKVIKTQVIKNKHLKGGYYEGDDELKPERGLFDSLKVDVNSSGKPRHDPPEFPDCCIL